MGIRPHFSFIVGTTVNGSNDPRFDCEVQKKFMDNQGAEEWIGDCRMPVVEEDKFDLITDMPLSCLPEERPWVHEIYHDWKHYQDDEHIQVVGYIVDQIARDDISYILMILFENCFMGNDIMLLPSYTEETKPGKYRDAWRRVGKDQQEKTLTQVDLAISEGRWIEYYNHWYTDRWFTKAIAVLGAVGWTGIQRKDLKLMLIKYWA